MHVGNTPSMRAFARVGFVADGSDGEFRKLAPRLAWSAAADRVRIGATYGVGVRVLLIGAGGVGRRSRPRRTIPKDSTTSW